ncbi:MAG: hypothetical protein U0575_00900 [Phycisphaerales bacterium]
MSRLACFRIITTGCQGLAGAYEKSQQKTVTGQALGPLRAAGDVQRFARHLHHQHGVAGSQRSDERGIQIELVAEDGRQQPE